MTFPVLKHRKVLQQSTVRNKDVLHLCRTVPRRHSETGRNIWVRIMLCHQRYPHRLTLLTTLPPLSPATYLPSPLDQCNGFVMRYCPSTDRTVCLCVFVWIGLLQVAFFFFLCVLSTDYTHTTMSRRCCFSKSHSVLQLMQDGACIAVRASSGCWRYNVGFTASLLRERHIYEEMSVKGEQGGRGEGEERGWEGDGEKCEHVNVREGGRCACWGWSLASGSSLCLPFSPTFSSRSFLHPLAIVEETHLQSFHHFWLSPQV